MNSPDYHIHSLNNPYDRDMSAAQMRAEEEKLKELIDGISDDSEQIADVVLGGYADEDVVWNLLRAMYQAHKLGQGAAHVFTASLMTELERGIQAKAQRLAAA